MVKFLFLSNHSAYTDQVKLALQKAGYSITLSCDDRIVKTFKDGLIISAAYGNKLPAGGLNLHPSLLPAYRGATPVPHQILDGVKKSGITIIKMTDKIDAGQIVAQKAVPVKPNDTSLDLLNRCFKAGADLLIKILPDYLNNKITLKSQPKKSPTAYCRRFTKQDGFISWEEFKRGADNKKILAFYPWPGIWTKMPNGKIIKLLPGNQLQLEGKQPISRGQFLTGYGHLLQ